MSDLSAPAFASPRDDVAIRVGDILNKTVRLFASRWATFTALAFVAFAPEFVYELLVPNPSRAWRLLNWILQCACPALADAAIVYGVLQQLRDREFTFFESLSVGFRRMGVVACLSLAFGLSVALTMLLLVVPGLIVWCMYAVAIPVCVAERLGVGASLNRSSYLTKGNRWRIFGTVGVVLIATMAAGAVLDALAALAGGERLGDIVMIPLQAVAGAVNAVAASVLYYRLRVVREGADIDKIAAVFD
jgi:hypothetical protein